MIHRYCSVYQNRGFSWQDRSIQSTVRVLASWNRYGFSAWTAQQVASFALVRVYFFRPVALRQHCLRKVRRQPSKREVLWTLCCGICGMWLRSTKSFQSPARLWGLMGFNVNLALALQRTDCNHYISSLSDLQPAIAAHISLRSPRVSPKALI